MKELYHLVVTGSVVFELKFIIYYRENYLTKKKTICEA